ncbi:Probable chitinase 2 [Eumeta japonica]|uniref:chitinase n=1 Tax=Eumeta variegata TaxID=151549 RepID=A0A4C1WJY0_EUMVA|nr:Probable chitinase 2 [Eumeta japonica]
MCACEREGVEVRGRMSAGRACVCGRSYRRICRINYTGPPDHGAPNVQVLFCYYGTWATYRTGWGRVAVEDIHTIICTHLVYTFVGVNLDGTVAILDPGLDLPSGKDNFRKFNALKQQNAELKTILAVGGYNEGSYKYSLMAASSTTRRNFVQSATNLVLEYGFDGFDIDWEYPNRRDTAYGQADVNNFSTLLKELREEFDKHGLMLTAAVAAVPSMAALSYDVAIISEYLDYINIMTYDMHGSWDSVTGHNAGLHRGEGDDNVAREDAYTVDVSVEYWLSQGCPPEKLVLGLPLYGRTFTLASADTYGVRASSVGARLSGPYTLTNGFLGYNEFCVKLQSESWNVFYDKEAKVPYAVQNRNWVSYDNDNSLTEKVKYGMNLDLAGAMVWSIETDDVHAQCHSETYHLLRTVNRAMGREFVEHSNEFSLSEENSTDVVPSTAIITSVYKNDLPSLAKDVQEIILYADDSSLLFKVKRQQPTYDDVNSAISKVEKWFTAKNLLLNEMKTKCIQFSLPNVRHGSGTISVRNKELEFVNSTVFLVITLDNRLQWGPHISKLAKRLSSAVYATKKMRNLSHVETARLVYFGCFHSLMSYGILLWGDAADIHKMFVLQKRAVRAIYQLGPRASVRNKFKKIGILSLASQFIYENLLYGKKFRNV